MAINCFPVTYKAGYYTPPVNVVVFPTGTYICNV